MPAKPATVAVAKGTMETVAVREKVQKLRALANQLEASLGNRIREWPALMPAAIWLIWGLRRHGKTALAWKIGEDARAKGMMVVAYRIPAKAQKALPAWVKHVSTLTEISKLKACLIIVDEAAFSANARESSSAKNIEWGKLVAICGHKDHAMIFLAQHNRQLDINVVTDASLVLFKPMSQLHLRFTRPELRPEMEQAIAAFDSAKGDPRAWTFVWDPRTGKTGFLQNGLPTFWSDGISKAFAEVELDAAKGAVTLGSVAARERREEE